MASTQGREDGYAHPSELVTFGQIRATLGVGKARGYQVTRDRDFPEPWFVSEDGTVRLWLRADVEAWLDGHRPGWRGDA
ncbi:hypothetical protein BBK14_02045 [Parafrankia soli]|uniref:DNA-binding protein n=1 Tax=Parafrankia soli TaxID=2599596 RepID=A0A1S1RMX4_9ACTN|nr:hypothetical protein [Parafrankia soli]OHV46652.1 hypothetical protein BBK14_02045 [Parafrankia soli]